MCDICIEAFNTLKPAIDAALEKHPGTVVQEGEPHAGKPVTRQHHVVVALSGHLRNLLAQEQQEAALLTMSLKNAA